MTGRWDKDWLALIKDTRKLVKTVGPLISAVPDLDDREIIRRQYHILNGRFKGDIDLGCDPSGASRELFALADLVFALIDEIE